MYLITYCYTNNRGDKSYHYAVVGDIVKWVDNTQKYDDDEYVLINVLEIDQATANRWDGSLKSM